MSKYKFIKVNDFDPVEYDPDPIGAVYEEDILDMFTSKDYEIQNNMYDENYIKIQFNSEDDQNKFFSLLENINTDQYGFDFLIESNDDLSEYWNLKITNSDAFNKFVDNKVMISEDLFNTYYSKDEARVELKLTISYEELFKKICVNAGLDNESINFILSCLTDDYNNELVEIASKSFDGPY